MSRAFTKEDDAGDDLPERPVPSGPNYVTPRGLELLRAAAKDLVARRQKLKAAGEEVKALDRDLRYLEARLGSATVVPRGAGPEIRFGARVTLEDEEGKRAVKQIVGEDEARTDGNFLPWSGPLALAMMGVLPGQTVQWEGPDRVHRYKVVAVDYPA